VFVTALGAAHTKWWRDLPAFTVKRKQYLVCVEMTTHGDGRGGDAWKGRCASDFPTWHRRYVISFHAERGFVLISGMQSWILTAMRGSFDSQGRTGEKSWVCGKKSQALRRF
ncbi:hypothetical protein NDU88_005700, partial [Pleurodeles waltl]